LSHRSTPAVNSFQFTHAKSSSLLANPSGALFELGF
jgi:hypothetical protein